MKKFKYLLKVFLVSALVIACVEEIENNIDFVDTIEVPTNIAGIISITQDNTGVVTITPTGEGVVSYSVNFGDGSNESESINPGNSVVHTYPEGTYEATIIAVGLNGEVTETVVSVVVSYSAPENLVVTINSLAGNPFDINVSASADLAASFEVYFGDQGSDEAPTPLQIGEILTYTYSTVGEYTVTVVALSGGAATTEYSEVITITNPLLMPIDFEDSTLNYSFVDFGNAQSTVIPNPDPTGVNTSATVGQSLKFNGSETWAGSFLTIDEPVDFSSLNNIAVDVWTSEIGEVIKLKLENSANPDINTEVDMTTSVNQGWETLIYDFSTSDLSQEYDRIVIFFDFGNVGDDTSYYFDNIRLSLPGVSNFMTVEDFQGDLPGNFSFGGVEGVQLVSNPNPTVVNTTSTVMQFTKTDGAEVWGGMGFAVDGIINFNGTNQIKINSYAAEAGKVVKVKLETIEGNVDGLTYEFDMTTTVANQWEVLTYDFSAAPDLDYVSFIVFYDFGNQNTGVYHFDEIQVGLGEYIPTQSPSIAIENFEGELPGNFSFGGVEGVQIVENPNVSGSNTTANVMQCTKTEGSEVWGGMGISVDPINFLSAGMNQIQIQSYSAEAGKVIKVKLETIEGNVDGLTYEFDMTTTIANEWETLTYDFSLAPDLDYVSFIVFYDFGNTGEGIYHFDEIKLVN
ncbi:hypothetical protein OAA78_04105 [Flavobacteriaceae bacterium]|nr:hypothetical protein [Flavobacteriaceae bacterium]MDC1492008.1 hypothetical protein [Flavobacteriaceae bacterium]MDC1534771.1 hypothetical protein [Flavobacteriaceae bacterium]